MAGPHHTLHAAPPGTRSTLALDAVSGPALPPIVLSSDAPAVLGRSGQSTVVMLDESVSRRHASIACRSGTWYITDLASRHGTHVNAVRLSPEAPAPLRTGDMVGIGPWTLRVRLAGEAAAAGARPPTSAAGAHRMVSMIDAAPVGVAPAVGGAGPGAQRERVERVAERELAQITSNRLQLLIAAAAAVTSSPDEASLASTIVRAAAEGTGFPRAFVLRDEPGREGELALLGEFPEPVAGPTGSSPAIPTFSRSLIAASRGGPDAPQGQLVRLTTDAPMTAASIMSLGIQTALCAPIVVGNGVGGFIYLDSRQGEGRWGGTGGINQTLAGRPPTGPGGGAGGVPNDAAAFCSALAKLYAMALSNLGRAELEKRQQELVRELEAAREVQKMIMPPETGSVGGVRYAMKSRSGRYVAGDLFDVVPLGSGRVAVLLGDVAGKGVPAAILMATAQTHLHVSLRSGAPLPEVVSAVNRHVCHHAMSSKFISLWIGVFDPAARTVEYVDAGHGYCLLLHPGGQAENTASTAIPLGIDEDFAFESSSAVVEPGARLVVFSDGVVEQPAAPPADESQMFGMDRAVAALRGSASVEDDVTRLFTAVLDYAKTDQLADDTTVASVELP
jgi:serine phosphatase RsbU (regulator of sigma subunit)